MTPELAVVLLVATLAALGSALALLVTVNLEAELETVGEARSGARWNPDAEDPERDPLDWEWRLRMASLPEAYWY